jgi:hypothetical protein
MSVKELFERDYRDIGYFVKHIKNLDFRESLIRSMGYRIGLNVITKDNKEMDVTIGKRKETRIQITPQLSKTPVAKCVILDYCVK